MKEKSKKMTMQPVRILHVEDNPNDAELLYAKLTASELEFIPTRVDNPVDFLAALDRGGFDLILCDYSLPSFSGKEALALAQEKCPEVPFIFASGTIGEDNAIEALKAGATDYVFKDRTARLGPAIGRALLEAEEHARRKQAEDRIIHLAYYDQLTGLANRTLLQERLQLELKGNTRLPLALLFMDLTRFTEINDTLGHQNGDLLLKEIGQRLQDTLPEAITIARVGNDTFAVLLLRTDKDAAGMAAEMITEALAAPFVLEGLNLEVGAHLGIVIAPDHGQDAPTLLRHAEVAMGVAKAKEFVYTIYSAEADPYRPEQLTLVSELRQAIHDGQLRLHYQPKVNLATGKVNGVEALLRWQHPQRGLLSPMQFIPLAEQTGLIKPMTAWALEEVGRQILRWQEQGLRLVVAVNLSARNLQDTEVADQVQTLLERSGLSPELLVLEITETMVMTDPAHALEQLTRLNRMGIRLAIDDFGTGYSSLTYLKRLPVQELKIDKTFVEGMMQDRNDAAIVRAAIDIARDLGLKVVAEGIEEKQTWHGLLALGCDEGQGYFISKPLPADEFNRWLRDYIAKLPA